MNDARPETTTLCEARLQAFVDAKHAWHVHEDVRQILADRKRLTAAHDRVWDVVKWLRDRALYAGADPYRDPIASALSAALTGVRGEPLPTNPAPGHRHHFALQPPDGSFTHPGDCACGARFADEPED